MIYEEDFEDGAANGWGGGFGFEVIQLSDGNHVWRTENGYSKLLLPIESKNYAFEVKTMQVSGDGGLAIMSIHVLIESGSPCDAMYMSYTDMALDWLTLVEGSTSCEEIRDEGGLFGAYKVELSNGVWYTRRLESKDEEVRLYLDGNLVLFDEDDTLKSNLISLNGCCEDSSHEFYFDDIRVWSID